MRFPCIGKMFYSLCKRILYCVINQIKPCEFFAGEGVEGLESRNTMLAFTRNPPVGRAFGRMGEWVKSGSVVYTFSYGGYKNRNK